MPSFKGARDEKPLRSQAREGWKPSEHDQGNLMRVLLASCFTAAVSAAKDSDRRGRANLENRSLHPLSRRSHFCASAQTPTRREAWLRFRGLEVNSSQVGKATVWVCCETAATFRRTLWGAQTRNRMRAHRAGTACPFPNVQRYCLPSMFSEDDNGLHNSQGDYRASRPDR